MQIVVLFDRAHRLHTEVIRALLLLRLQFLEAAKWWLSEDRRHDSH